MIPVSIRVGDPYLRRALGLATRDLGSSLGSADGGHPGLILTTAADCSPDECRALAAEGAHVLVLVQFPHESARAAYAEAGAAGYVAMGGGMEGLRDTVVAAAAGPLRPPGPRGTANGASSGVFHGHRQTDGSMAVGRGLRPHQLPR